MDSAIKRRFDVSTWKNILLIVIISAVMTAGSIFFYHRYYAPRIVAIDIRGYVASQRSLFMEGKLSKEDLDANLSKIRSLLDTLPDNAVAIVSDVVIKNAETINP